MNYKLGIYFSTFLFQTLQPYKMNFQYSQKSLELQAKLTTFIEEHIIPIEDEYLAFQSDEKNKWKRFPKIEELKQKAKDAGLWNLFLPKEYGNLSPGLTNLEYAPLAEIMGKKSGYQKFLIVLLQILAIWKCWQNMVQIFKKKSG